MQKIKDSTNSMKDEVKKFKNKDFLAATVAGCAMVAAADGVIDAEEKRKMIGFIGSNDALSVFDSAVAIDLFQKYTAKFDFDIEIGRGECLAIVGKLKKSPEQAQLMVRVCCAVGASDGDFDKDEQSVVRSICKALALDPEDFGV